MGKRDVSVVWIRPRGIVTSLLMAFKPVRTYVGDGRYS